MLDFAYPSIIPDHVIVLKQWTLNYESILYAVAIDKCCVWASSKVTIVLCKEGQVENLIWDLIIIIYKPMIRSEQIRYNDVFLKRK